MTIASVLRHKGHQVITVEPTETIAQVAKVLTAQHIGAVLVMDRAEQMLGVLSERDIVVSLAAHGAATLSMTAGQLMTQPVHVVQPHATVGEAMSVMTEGRFRHLPVVDNGVLVGLISIGDIGKARIMEHENEVDNLRAYVAGN